MKISVLIPTHDRARMLAGTLDSLVRVEPTRHAAVEIVVVANACEDDTLEVVAAADPDLPLRCVQEEELGLNAARNRGLSEAEGEVVAFLDDDVIVAPTWLQAVEASFESPPADVVAGPVKLLLESDPIIPVTDRVQRLLSATDLGRESIELDDVNRVVGANFAIRRDVARRVGPFAKGLDRKGRDLLSGGDSEFLSRAKSAGCRAFYSPEMLVEHVIPSERLQVPYLLRLARGRGRTRALLARSRHGRGALQLVRLGLAQILLGSVRCAVSELKANEGRALNARILLHTGLGCLQAIASRGKLLAPTRAEGRV